MDTTTIGGRLDKAMRESKVDSQAQLARLSGVPQPTINRILKGQGKKGPESATLISLADALGIELLWLQQGKGPQKAGMAVESKREEQPRLRVVEPQPATKLQWVTELEAELLSEFRACEEPQRKTLLAAARGLPKAVTGAVAGDKA